MSDERRRASDIQDDDLDGRRVDRWPVDAREMLGPPPPRGYFSSLRCRWIDVAAFTPDPLDDLMAIRGCEGCP